MNLKKIIAGVLSAMLMVSTLGLSTFAETFPEMVETPKISGIKVNQPDVILKIDYKKGFTTLLICIPDEKFELFEKMNDKFTTQMNMFVWFGGISGKRDDSDRQIAQYHVSYYYCGEGENIENEWIGVYGDGEDVPEDDYESEKFVTKDGTHCFALSLREDTRVAKAARKADQFRISYYMKDMFGTIDGNAGKSYITKTETGKPMQEFPELDCSKPNVELLDNWQEGCSTLFFVIPKEKYEKLYQDDIISDHPRINMTANFSDGRSAKLTLRAMRGLELTAYSADGVPDKGKFSVQSGFTQNGDYIAALTCDSDESFMDKVKADQNVTMSYSMTSEKGLVDGSNEPQVIYDFYPPEIDHSKLDFTQPSVSVSTDCYKGYVSAIFTVPAEKVKLFKEKYSKDDQTSMNMNLFFQYDNWAMVGIDGDGSYSMEAFEADCTADGGFRTWLEYTDNGDLIGVLSCSDNAPWAQSLRASRDCTLAYYVTSAQNVLVDGSNVGHTVQLGVEREVISGYETAKPDIFVSTDYKPGYTSLIYSVPKKKYELFKKTKANAQSENEATLGMKVLFGNFSEERDMDDELPDSAYHVDFYLTDPDGGEDGCTIETFAEDNQVDYMPMIKEFYTKDGGYAVAVCFKDSDSIARKLESADEFRVYYYIQSKGKYVDGSWDKYTTKSLRTDISTLKFGKISNKAYTGKALKPAVIIRDGKKKLVNGTDYAVSYKNNRNTGTATVTITGKGEYKGTKTLKFNIVPPKTTLTSKPGKTSGGWNRATLSWKKSAGADGYQIYYSENGGIFKKLTTVVSSGKLSRAVKYTIGDTEQFKIRPYKKVNGKTCFGAWSNIVTLN